MKITKKQSITDKFAKAFIKGGGSISLKDLISDEKEDMESVLKALLEQQNLSEEQKKQLLQIIKVTKKNTRGLRDLDELQQEAFDQAREQGKSIFQSLKAADKLKEDYEAATTGMRSRFGKIVTAFGGSEELAQVADLVFGKRVSKEERKELAEKFKVKREKKTKTKAAQGDAQQVQQQTATKKPRGRIDPVTGKFVRTNFGSQILQKQEDPFAPVLTAISETPKLVDELIEEEILQEDIKKILESVGEKKQPFDVHDKLNMILKAVGADALSDLLDIGGGGGDGKRKRRRRGPVGRRGGGVGRFGVGSLLGGAAVGGLAYMAVDSFRDQDLVSEDPEVLKQQAKLAETPEEKQEIQEQITAQKQDIKMQAAATGAGIAGAVGGAVAVKKIAETKAVQKVKNKTWDLFMGFLKKRAPKLFAQVGVRLAAAGGLALIPFVGWISAAVTVVGSLWLAYDLYKLWKEFSALSEAEQELYADDIEKKADAEVQAAPTTSPTSIEPAPAATSFPNAAGTTSSMAPPTTAPAVAPIRVSSSMPGAMPAPAETGASAEELKKYVRLKDSSINLDGLNPQMKERLAGLAKEYFNKTGQKIQINSGYRSPEEQAALFAKYGAPRAAPPGRSRHESGLAIDINSTDANKAIELGLMAKYGFTRPVPGETWHVEPIETAKRGATPDNPYKPGAPIVASNNGNEIDPKSGRAPSSGVASLPAKQAEMGTAVAAAPPRTETPGVAEAAPSAVTATPITPTPVSGTMVAQQTTAVTSAKEEMMTSAAPAVVPVPVGGQSQGAKPMPPSNAAPASTRDSESSFARALAKDFAHPSAFTTIGTV